MLFEDYPKDTEDGGEQVPGNQDSSETTTFNSQDVSQFTLDTRTEAIDMTTVTETFKLHEEDGNNILALLKTGPKANKYGKWDNKTLADIIQSLTEYSKAKQLYNDDLRVVVHYFRMIDAEFKSKESDTKAKKLEAIGLYLGHQVTHEPKKKETAIRITKISPKISEIGHGFKSSKNGPQYQLFRVHLASKVRVMGE